MYEANEYPIAFLKLYYENSYHAFDLVQNQNAHYFYFLLLHSAQFILKLVQYLNKGNNKITELRTILQRESQNS